MSDSQRTHRPSPKRIKDFRKRGEIALSRDLVSAATLAGAVIGLVVGASAGGGALVDLTARTMRGDLDVSELGEAGASAFGWAAGPAMIGAALGAIAATFAQLGWPPAWKSIGFDLSKLSPIGNIRQQFSFSSSIRRVGGALAKLAVIGIVVVVALAGVDRIEPASATVAAGRTIGIVTKVLIAATAAFVGIAAIDYILARRKIASKMRMTPDEVKREHKEQEGDPTVKGQRKRKMRELARRRIAVAVKSAAVVVVNPTHYAVALRYDEGSDRAPVVVAKGVDEAAEKIRELARGFGVPVLERPPLARALHKTCKEGREVPVALYRAVAEVLAYVYRLRRARGNAS
jgi:flagellar biosynthetic protein FlhB